MITIKNISAVSDSNELFRRISIQLKPNTIHAIVGPESSGKSSLAQCLAANPSIIQTEGTIEFSGKNINRLDAIERAKLGLFVSHQYPPTLDGVTNREIFNLALHQDYNVYNENELDQQLRYIIKKLGLAINHGERYFNGISSTQAERLKNELILMFCMKPSVAVLDSIDNDMDPEETQIIAEIVNNFIKQQTNACIVLTNNRYFIEQLDVSEISVMVNGQIRATGDRDIIYRIIDDDYSQLF